MLSVPLIIAGSVALSGCGSRSATNPTTISYHQVGVCKSFNAPTGSETAKPNEVFAVYKIETVDNTKQSSVFYLDAERVYVDQTAGGVGTKNLSFQVRRFMIPGPRFAQALGVKALEASSTPANEKLDLNSFIVVPVSIKGPAGGAQAAENFYDLIYDTTTTEVQTGKNDVVLKNSNSAASKYPAVENCKELSLN